MIRPFFSLFIILFLSSLSLPLYSNSLPENHAVNGGVTIVPIDVKKEPEVFYQQHRVATVKSTQHPNQWLLIVGIPLNAKGSIDYLQMTKPYKTTIPFHSSDKFYPIQSLIIKNKRKVDPYAKDRLRIEKENRELAHIFSQYTTTNPFLQAFKAPANGPISSLFGLRRIYNHKPRTPHTGLDIAAPANAPVHAVNPGKVVAVASLFFTGNTVIVDHGMGVFSLYAHLDKTQLKEGQQLKQGDEVGTVGMTGRATGPHLHWSMIMNQTYVDPLLFVPARVITQAPIKKHQHPG